MKIQAALAGRFELETVVGIGPHGTVWRARATATGAVHAVKILERQYAADDLIVGRFVRDRPALQAPVHAAWVHVRELVVADEGLALISDFVHGADLRAGHARSGPLTVDQAITVAMSCADALAAAHGQGIVHGNLTPGNILVGDPAHDVRLTDARLTWLTRQAPGGAHVPGPPTAAADIFQVGAVLYEMLTSRTLPGGGAPPLLPDSVDSVLAPLIYACLADQPGDRPTAEQLAVELRALPAGGAADNRLVRRYITDEWVPPARHAAEIEAPVVPDHGVPHQVVPETARSTELEPVAPRPPTEIVAGGHRREGKDGRRRTTYLVAVAVVLVTLAAGVIAALLRGRDEEQPAARPSVGQVSTSVEAPLEPSAAGAQTAKGAEAFVPFWFATLNYALTTGNTEPFKAASAPACQTCTAAAEKIAAVYGAGGTVSGTSYLVRSVRPDSFLTLDRPILRVVFDRSPGTIAGPSSPGELSRLTFSSCQIVLTWSDGGWSTADAQTSVPLA